MKLRLERSDQDYWQAAALAVVGLALALVWMDAAFWHAGYAYGDECDIVAGAQRLREGMPFRWDISGGSLHRLLLWASMDTWPGRLWATSVPALAALGLEGCLLFALGRRLGGQRAGFFAVLAGVLSAFTLVRARVSLSFSLFPAEWLFLVWVRFYCRRPWAWVLWGAVLGLFCFDYEAWLPMAVLLLALPFPQALTWRQRAWELLGLGLILSFLLPPGALEGYLQRRQAASLLQARTGSAGWKGLKGLVFGDVTLPYMAPRDFAILPPWTWALLPLGLGLWRQRLWVPLSYLALGLALPLMGGAPYGLPGHRAIALWPLLALVSGLGLERLAQRPLRAGLRWALVLVLALLGCHQLWAWQFNQAAMDARFRGPIRDLKRAADLGWEQSRVLKVPLVTELHPMLGAQFRFLTGHTVPLPDAGSNTVVAFLPWEYLPAVRGHVVVEGRTFQEEPGYVPALVALFRGPQAAQCVEAERNFRPLLLQAPQYSLRSDDLVFDWLKQHRGAGTWSRTLAVDYLMTSAWYNVRLYTSWAEDAYHEPLVSAHPLLVAAHGAELSSPEWALKAARRARAIDPCNAETWALERKLLEGLHRDAEVAALDKARAPYEKQGLLFTE